MMLFLDNQVQNAKKLNNKINEEMKCIFKCQNGCLLPARFCNNYAVSSLASGV